MVTNIGNIDFQSPERDLPIKMTLFVHLSGGEYDIDNNWDLWVFPKTDLSDIPAEAEEDVINKFGLRLVRGTNEKSLRIVSKICEKDIDFLNNGGRVVLLGSKPFPNSKTEFQINMCGRVEGNEATVIADHPLMLRFPHEGFCDWQFYNMLNSGSAINFNDVNLPFNPILEMVSTYKNIRKQASIFELEAGKGKLLVCSLNIDRKDPAGMFLLGEMLRYADSDKFLPETKITIEQLAKAIKLKQTKEIKDDANDRGYDPRAREKK